MDDLPPQNIRRYDPAKAMELLAEAGHPNGFDAGEFFCDASYSNVAEALLNNFAEVGIKSRLRPDRTGSSAAASSLRRPWARCCR